MEARPWPWQLRCRFSQWTISRAPSTTTSACSASGRAGSGESRRSWRMPRSHRAAARAARQARAAGCIAGIRALQRRRRALGFHTNWEEGDLAELELAGVRVLLQNFYPPGRAGNFMIHIRVPDADAWDRHAHAALAAGDFPGTKVEGPREE